MRQVPHGGRGGRGHCAAFAPAQRRAGGQRVGRRLPDDRPRRRHSAHPRRIAPWRRPDRGWHPPSGQPGALSAGACREASSAYFPASRGEASHPHDSAGRHGQRQRRRPGQARPETRARDQGRDDLAAGAARAAPRSTRGRLDGHRGRCRAVRHDAVRLGLPGRRYHRETVRGRRRHRHDDHRGRSRRPQHRAHARASGRLQRPVPRRRRRDQPHRRGHEGWRAGRAARPRRELGERADRECAR